MERSHNHRVQILGVQRSGPAALVNNKFTDPVHRTFAHEGVGLVEVDFGKAGQNLDGSESNVKVHLP